MAAIRVERYSTASAPRGSRLAYWNAVASQTFSNLVIDSEDRDDFKGELIRAPLGRLDLMSADCSRARVMRTNDAARSARGPRNFDLHFQISGSSLNRQGGREAVLEAGDFTICDATQPYSVSFTEANHMLCLKLPAEALAAKLGDVEGLLCRPISARRGGPATLSAFLRTVWSQLSEPGDEEWAEGVSEVILDLIDLAYRPAQERTSALSPQDHWRQKVKALIDERLCDPDLGARSIAGSLGLSSRYVQMLFAEASTTPSAYILERRLKLAAERLRRCEGRGVTEVAMAVGFNDLTHFGRVFRRRFGVTPSEYRSGGRATAWAAGGPSEHTMAG